MRLGGHILVGTAIAAASAADDTLVTARLIADAASVSPGSQITIGVELAPQPGWKLYWINPGDSGLPPSVEWTLPEGVTAGPIQWPAPRLFRAEGQAIYGYSERVILPVQLTIASDAPAPGHPLLIRARVDWLACREACVPGGSDLALKLAWGDRVVPDAEGARRIQDARRHLPQTAPPGAATAHAEEGGVRINFRTPEGADPAQADTVHFFPESGEWMDASAPQTWVFRDGAWSGRARRAENARVPDRIHGILRIGGNAWDIRAPVRPSRASFSENPRKETP